MPIRRILTGPFEAFSKSEAKSGIVLMAAALAAILWANVAGTNYEAVWTQMGWDAGFGIFHLRFWINDGLMAVFFLLVGLEIKREILAGELSTARKAALPVVAAAGGMLVPAAIYSFFNLGKAGMAGWAIPMATDIAFALGILTLLGSRVPNSLKVFLAAVAIADDLGAVLIIAIFFTKGISFLALGGALAGIGLLACFNKFGVRGLAWYLVPGIGIWAAFLASGVHATVAGVLVAFCIPIAAIGSESPLERLEHALNAPVAYIIVPLFALANAGVRLSGVGDAISNSIAPGIAAGLVVGKPVGICFASWIAMKLKLASLPAGVSLRMLVGVGILAGIGFTMALFIGELAFPGSDLLAQAKIGIVAASLVAGIGGYALLRSSLRPSGRASA